jgi:hypothetical protein
MAATMRHFSSFALTTAMGSSEQLASWPDDQLGDPKIPRWEALNSTATAGGWKDVPLGLAREDYASSIGLRVAGLSRHKETRFSVEASYLTVDCDPFTQPPYSYNLTHTDIERLSHLAGFNFSAPAADGWMLGASVKTTATYTLRAFFIDTDRRWAAVREMAYLGLQGNAHDVSAGRQPVADQLRGPRLRRAPHLQPAPQASAQHVLRQRADRQPGRGSPNLAQYGNATAPVCDLDVFIAPQQAQREARHNFTAFYDAARNATMQAMLAGLPFVGVATTAAATVSTPIFVCHFTWLSVLLLAAAALLCAGIAALARQLRCTLAPNMLRYVASMT